MLCRECGCKTIINNKNNFFSNQYDLYECPKCGIGYYRHIRHREDLKG